MIAALSITQCTESNGLDDQMTPGSEKTEAVIQGAELTEAEIEGIRFMREEEKVARDVYIYLYEIYPLRPFLNISKSEQAHMDAIKYLIDTYELEDPVGENPEGVFQNEELQTMYDELIETGSTSREDALKVGALIEEIDILDIQHELDEHVDNQDVTFVYDNLLKGSRNHLRAFVRNLSRQGVEYTPQKLSEEQYLAIINGE
ncbi:MAG: DUF2202 domain-containing protein [Bacteroidales bacterium]|nr:DUF2202 domain-containing protein [Bacteroidales bacterium]